MISSPLTDPPRRTPKPPPQPLITRPSGILIPIRRLRHIPQSTLVRREGSVIPHVNQNTTQPPDELAYAHTTKQMEEGGGEGSTSDSDPNNPHPSTPSHRR